MRNVLFVLILAGLAVGLIMAFVFSLLDRRQYRQLAARDGWSYTPSATRPRGVTSVVMNAQGTNGVRYRHLVSGPGGEMVFRRTHQATRWDGNPDTSDRVKVTWLYVHLPDTAARPCTFTWTPDGGVTTESGDDIVERTVATTMFAERLDGSPAHPQHMLIEVGPTAMLVGMNSGVVPDKIPELVDWVRSVERLLPTR